VLDITLAVSTRSGSGSSEGELHVDRAKPNFEKHCAPGHPEVVSRDKNSTSPTDEGRTIPAHFASWQYGQDTPMAANYWQMRAVTALGVLISLARRPDSRLGCALLRYSRSQRSEFRNGLLTRCAMAECAACASLV